jgi:DNA-binding CsgD family transcriptional regulator
MADPGIHVVSRVLAQAEAGRLEEAGQIAGIAYDTSLSLRNVTGQGWFALMLGRIALVTGALADAAARFREAAVTYRALGQDGPRRWCIAGQILAAAMTGDPTTATSLLAELDAVPTQPMRMMEPDVLRARAWESLGRGDLAAARAGLVEAANCAEQSHAPALALLAWHDLARIGSASSAVDPVDRLGSMDGPLPSFRAAHVKALAGHDVDGLVAAADGFESVGAILLAAESAAAAGAEAHRAGQPRVADRLGRRARLLAARCQGARTPALDLAGATRALTSRERQVAVLAAEGLASKVIAARLGLAVRTVDNHLQHAYDKLGVADRIGLREAIRHEPEV